MIYGVFCFQTTQFNAYFLNVPAKSDLTHKLPQVLKARNEFYVEYVFKDGLYHRNYAGSFISLVYLPVDLSQKKDSILKSDVDVQIVTPNYIVTSSILEAKTIFLLEDGVYYSFGFKRKQTGILINLENESASAFRDIMMLFITTVFGFTLGSLFEKYAARLKN